MNGGTNDLGKLYWDLRALQAYLEDGFRDCADGQVELQCALEVGATPYEEGTKFHISSEVRNLSTLTKLCHVTQSSFHRDLVERLTEQPELMQLVSIEGGHLVPMTGPDRVAAGLSLL